MTGNQAIAKILKAEGLDWFACFPHHSLIDAAAKEGLRPILTRQERAGVNMADGYSRIMSGNRIGVFMMQDGPGAENAFGGVAQAYADSVPILLLPGGTAPRECGNAPGLRCAPELRWGYQVDRIHQSGGPHPPADADGIHSAKTWEAGTGALGDSYRCCRAGAFGQRL